MKLLNIALSVTSASAVLAAPNEKRAGKFLFTGVNVAGGEFGSQTLPGRLGKEYTWPANSAIDVLFPCCVKLLWILQDLM
jgi:endoglucanase